MATQKPSVDWSLRTDPLDGTEHLLKQNPAGTATNGADEERVTTQLMLNFVLANLPTLISQIQLDDANVTFNALTSIFTITETNGDVITVPFDPLFKLKQAITVDGVTFTTANTYDDVLIALNVDETVTIVSGIIITPVTNPPITPKTGDTFINDNQSWVYGNGSWNPMIPVVSNTRNTGKIAYVSKNGNNTTSVIGDPFKAFLDPWSAANFARANPTLIDEVYIFAGTYNVDTDYTGQTDELMIWDNGRVYCEAGVIFKGAQAIIKTITNSQKFSLTGYSEYEGSFVMLNVSTPLNLLDIDIEMYSVKVNANAFQYLAYDSKISLKITNYKANRQSGAISYMSSATVGYKYVTINIDNFEIIGGDASGFHFGWVEMGNVNKGALTVNIKNANLIYDHTTSNNGSYEGVQLMYTRGAGNATLLQNTNIVFNVNNFHYESTMPNFTGTVHNGLGAISDSTLMDNNNFYFKVGNMSGELSAYLDWNDFAPANKNTNNVLIEVGNIQMTKDYPVTVFQGIKPANQKVIINQGKSNGSCVVDKGSVASFVTTTKNKFKVSGHLTTTAALPVIDLVKYTSASTQNTLSLENLKLINDGTVSAISTTSGAPTNIVIQNVVTNTDTTDANVTEVGQGILRFNGYN
jgi:hypothetical protein